MHCSIARTTGKRTVEFSDADDSDEDDVSEDTKDDNQTAPPHDVRKRKRISEPEKLLAMAAGDSHTLSPKWSISEESFVSPTGRPLRTARFFERR